MKDFEKFVKELDDNFVKMAAAHDQIMDILSELPEDIALTILGDLTAMFAIKNGRSIEETHETMAEVGATLKAQGMYDFLLQGKE